MIRVCFSPAVGAQNLSGQYLTFGPLVLVASVKKSRPFGYSRSLHNMVALTTVGAYYANANQPNLAY